MDYKVWQKQTAVIFTVVCSLLFVAGLSVHLSALFDIDFAAAAPNVWFFLQISVVFGFLPFLIGNPFKRFSKSPYVWGSAKYREPSKFGAYFLLVIGILFCLSLLYLVFGAVYWSSQLSYGYLEIRDGSYFLYLKREHRYLPLSVTEYEKLSLFRNLLHSTHWMVLHLLGVLLNLPEDSDLKDE